ncbi:Glutathione S-transferase-like protein ustS [Psilocybe cubensis]|uniref:Glutathione S-transferase-like protein ustS n=2 Tax=Psilocybe cubensis TaxID=181762 RepID=A0ACB8GKG2_PSICU|nr:Glutathione S-transferase-like protein ustS [Psilocybe cubensis]KAH9476123.1 Glutathione S-transferase-like protein ustS [Psilocybe cubensis]
MSSRYGTSSRNMPPKLVLYDVRGHGAQPWMPNIWRIRFILNFKGLPYETVWIELQDVERALSHIKAPPSSVRSDGRPVYTLPVIVDPTRNPHSPIILSNSNTIAEYLEDTYPARPIFPQGSRAVQALFVHYIQEVFSKPLLPILVPMSHHQLPHSTQTHFRGGQAPATTLVGPQREMAWQAAREQFDFLAAIMDKNKGDGYGDGVVAYGNDVTYADFALCSILIWIKRMDAHEGWARVRTWNQGRWSRLLDRCRPFMDEC